MNRVVVKIGGELAASIRGVKSLAREMAALCASCSCVIVHGGGGELTEQLRKVGLEPKFKDGIRMTSSQEMEYVDMVLAGSVNKRLVRLFQEAEVNAVGICGADGRLFTGAGIEADSRTGEIKTVNTEIVETFLKEGFLPIISSTSMDEEDGRGLNINADSVAFALAVNLQSDRLIFLSNIPGILKEGKILASLTAREALAEIESGTITTGMVPKVKSSLRALESGVATVLIGEYRQEGDLRGLLNGGRGTRIF